MLRLGLAAIAIALTASAPLASSAHADSASDFIAKWDTDHDETLDLAEINKAADVEFGKLDVDHDGTLDQKELGNRVTKAEFMATDKDHDGTLDKAEYQSLVAKRFSVANRDKDTTIEVNELRTGEGRKLLRLLQ